MQTDDIYWGGVDMVWYGIVFKHLYSALPQSWANRGSFGSISSEKRDKFLEVIRT